MTAPSQTWASQLTSTDKPARFERLSYPDKQAALVAAWMHAQRAGTQTMNNASQTPSMLGKIKTQSMSSYIPAEKVRDWAAGDVVILRNAQGGLTLHEATHVRPDAVFTKGTFNSSGDGWIPLTKLVGRVDKSFDWK